jgi:hypothetical protein
MKNFIGIKRKIGATKKLIEKKDIYFVKLL